MFDKMKKPGMMDMSPVEKDAKMSVLDQIKQLCEGQMGDKLKGLKQVTVAGNDPSALEKGLNLAKGLVAKPEGSADEEAGETPEEESSEDALDLSPAHLTGAHSSDDSSDMDHMSEDEINEKLEQLMALKEKMQAGKA